MGRRRRSGVQGALQGRLLRWPVLAVCSLSPCVATAADASWRGPSEPTQEPEQTKPRVPEGLVSPQLLEPAVVEYPKDLAAADNPPAGSVTVRYTIGEDGTVRDIEVVESLHPRLDALARQAVSGLRYRPATLEGQPVPVIQRIAIAFEPPPREPEPEPDPEPEPADTVDEPSPPADSPLVDAAGPVRIEGEVLEAGQRTPIEGATVVVVPTDQSTRSGIVRKTDYAAREAPRWEAQGTTDAEGRFEIRGIPSGKVRVIVLAPGYERLEIVEALIEDQSIEVRYYPQRLATNPYRTVVRVDNPRQEVARRTITVEEINALPGTQGDALKSIQNFPGVARSPFGAGLLVVRGTGPNDSKVYLGEHEIPQLFHFGGLTSVFNSDILERIDFYPGNFDSRYGDAIGGIIDVTPRAGRRDGYHGYIDSDVFDTGVLVEGPVGKGSFALSGRRSYIDVLLPFVVPDDAGLDLTVSPRYYDYQALFDYPVGGGTLSVRGFGSDDKLALVAADPNEIETDDRNRFETSVLFHRADIVYRKQKGPWEFLITPSYRYDSFDLGISDLLTFNLRVHNFNGRAELTHRLSRRAALTVGTEFQSFLFEVDVQAPALPDSGGGSSNTRLGAQIDGFTAIPAVYGSLQLDLTDRFTLYPGVRAAYYASPYEVSTVDPRLRMGWQVADRTTLKAGVGLYSQVSAAVESTQEFGNPRIGPERAVQTSVGVLQELAYGINLDATVFANYLFDRTAPSVNTVRRPDGTIGAENFANTRTGRVFGLEVLARKELTANVFGWIAYTVSRSDRKDPQTDGQYVLFDFDQTHILTLIGVYRLPKNWQVGARFRLVSGNPNTPIIGSTFDAISGAYIPIAGDLNADRFPTFHQLDIRVDKKWIWRRVSLNLYLDVLNVYNAQNVEFWNYSYNFGARQEIPSLPIIPSLGTRLEF